MAATNVKLVHTKSGEEFDVTIDGLDVFFPDHVDGWSDVLDARIAPYKTQSVDEVREFALHVRKDYVLVPA